MPIPCARCEMPLSKWEYGADGKANCSLCGSGNTVRAFPAVLATAAAALPETALAGEASCFDHPNKRAVAGCSECGRYLCALCAVDFGPEIWCPSCVSKRAGRAHAANLETSRMLYDSMALTLPLASLILYPLTVLAAPASLVIALAKWKHPLSLVRRNRWRMVAALVISVTETVLWTWLVVYLFKAAATRAH
jgi:hypothetical protein